MALKVAAMIVVVVGVLLVVMVVVVIAEDTTSDLVKSAIHFLCHGKTGLRRIATYPRAPPLPL